MTDELRAQRARKAGFPGFAAYLEARAELEANQPEPDNEPHGLDALEARNPKLKAAVDRVRASLPGVVGASDNEPEEADA